MRLLNLWRIAGNPGLRTSYSSRDDSERCVEIPWCAASVLSTRGFWLDVGFAHAESRYWETIFERGSPLFRYDMGIDFSSPKMSVPLARLIEADLISDDLSSLPRFNLVTCISTIEHVGCDNITYNSGSKRMKDPFEVQKKVFLKLAELLVGGGQLLVSVPFGKFEDHGWFLQYDDKMFHAIEDLMRENGLILTSTLFYCWTEEGWKEAKISQVNEAEYSNVHHRASAVALLRITRN